MYAYNQKRTAIDLAKDDEAMWNKYRKLHFIKAIDSCVRHWIQRNGKESNRIERLILDAEKKKVSLFNVVWP